MIMSFRLDWEPEFATSNLDAFSLRALSFLTAIFLSISVTYDFFIFGCLFKAVTKLILALTLAGIFVYLQMISFRERRLKNYNIWCSMVVLTIYSSAICCQYISSPVVKKENFNHDIEFRSWNRKTRFILPDACCCYAVVGLLPSILKMSPVSVVLVTITEAIILTFVSVMNQEAFMDLVFAAIFQASAGFAAAHVCSSQLRVAREHFSLAKAAKFAAEQTSNRLHTLIPKQVLPALAAHTGEGMLGALIPHCTVMFCSLHLATRPSMSLADHHRLLDGVFSALDDAVRRSGMFKYQHVGEWYIVACPRAAAPFDVDLQERPYPADHVIAMLRLATELQVLNLICVSGARTMLRQSGNNDLADRCRFQCIL